MDADYDLTEMAMNAERGANGARFDKDDRLVVEFYMHPKLDRAQSDEANRPIYCDSEYIMIMVPGDKNNIVRRPVTELDRQRFRDKYTKWRQNKAAEQVSGTPLSKWPGVSQSQVRELEYFGIRTVEQLVDMPDVHAQNFAGINSLRAAARAYLEATKVGGMEKLMEEFQELKARFEESQSEEDEEVEAEEAEDDD